MALTKEQRQENMAKARAAKQKPAIDTFDSAEGRTHHDPEAERLARHAETSPDFDPTDDRRDYPYYFKSGDGPVQFFDGTLAEFTDAVVKNGWVIWFEHQGKFYTSATDDDIHTVAEQVRAEQSPDTEFGQVDEYQPLGAKQCPTCGIIIKGVVANPDGSCALCNPPTGQVDDFMRDTEGNQIVSGVSMDMAHSKVTYEWLIEGGNDYNRRIRATGSTLEAAREYALTTNDLAPTERLWIEKTAPEVVLPESKVTMAHAASLEHVENVNKQIGQYVDIASMCTAMGIAHTSGALAQVLKDAHDALQVEKSDLYTQLAADREEAGRAMTEGIDAQLAARERLFPSPKPEIESPIDWSGYIVVARPDADPRGLALVNGATLMPCVPGEPTDRIRHGAELFFRYAEDGVRAGMYGGSAHGDSVREFFAYVKGSGIL